MFSIHLKAHNFRMVDSPESERIRIISLKDMFDFKHISLVKITEKSPLKHRKILERYGWYFKLEECYDFMPYHSSYDNDYQGVLFNDRHNGYYFGGAGFTKNNSKLIELSWVWFHPWKRNAGIFSHFWNELNSMFGDFYPQTPLSKEMLAIIKKKGFDISVLNNSDSWVNVWEKYWNGELNERH